MEQYFLPTKRKDSVVIFKETKTEKLVIIKVKSKD